MRRGPILAVMVIGYFALVAVPLAATAQPKGKAKGKDEKPFEDVTLDTKDGLTLQATYYPGENSKTTVPVILVHGWGGSRVEMHQFATFLQQQLKQAVIVPDLRGHGGSPGPKNAAGEPIELDRMNRGQLAGMTFDIEAAKSFLMQKNNLGELNIEQLCVMGFEFGSLLAMNWAVLDWNAQPLPTLKQGQDVKALVLFSPIASFKGLGNRDALAHPVVRKDLSILIFVGEQDSSAVGEANRLHRALERFHAGGEQDLVLVKLDTDAQGAGLLRVAGRQVAGAVGQFTKDRLVERATQFRWTDRTSPFSK